MITTKRYSILFVLLILICTAGTVYAADQQNQATGSRTIVDSSGASVQVPNDISKVVILCQGGATQDVVILGGVDKIVGEPPQNSAPLLLKMFPSLKDQPNAGSFDNINMESVLKLEPENAINSVTAKKGNPDLTKNGIPVVQLLTGMAQMDTILPEFKMLGDVFNNPTKADEIISYWNDTVKLVNQRTNSIPDSEKKHVYYMLGGPLHTNGVKQWGHAFVTTGGGINVADDIGNIKDIDAEKLTAWDPDVIIVSSNEGKYVTDDEIKNNPQLSQLKAVKSGSIYHVPIGGFWWDRPSPESPLGFLWLAKTLYPDKFADIDMKSETKKFFNTFYGYDISDSEIEQILKAEAPAS